jgi:hypothetical protein
METHARRASQASTRVRQEMRTAAGVRQTRARLRRAQLAGATLATQGPMEACARCAQQASTKSLLDRTFARTAGQGSIPKQ